MALSRPKKAGLIGLGLLVIVAVSVLKIRGMLQRGEPVFWLAELWAPAAFLSIGLVTCLDLLMPAQVSTAAAKAPRKARKKAQA